MNAAGLNFREFLGHFCALPITARLKKAIAGFPGAEKATLVLAYGYIDADKGLMLELLAGGADTIRLKGDTVALKEGG